MRNQAGTVIGRRRSNCADRSSEIRAEMNECDVLFQPEVRRATRASARDRKPSKAGRQPRSWHHDSLRTRPCLVERLWSRPRDRRGITAVRRDDRGELLTSRAMSKDHSRGATPNSERLRRATLRGAHHCDDVESATGCPSKVETAHVRMMRTRVRSALPVEIAASLTQYCYLLH